MLQDHWSIFDKLQTLTLTFCTSCIIAVEQKKKSRDTCSFHCEGRGQGAAVVAGLPGQADLFIALTLPHPHPHPHNTTNNYTFIVCPDIGCGEIFSVLVMGTEHIFKKSK